MRKKEDIVTHWKIDSVDDVKRLWASVQSVPARTQGRKHFQEDRYCLGLYLLALGTHDLLRYPIHVEQGESPDFMVTSSSGEVSGLEVTRATTEEMQRRMTEDDREWYRREAAAAALGETPEPVVRELDEGLVGDQPERTFCELFQQAVRKKIEILPKYRPASRYDLLIADDMPVGGVDRRKVIAGLRPLLLSLDAGALKLGTISGIISLDLLFDLRGATRVLPYIDWNAPRLDQADELREFSERIEYAGWYTTGRALQRHSKEHHPVYAMDSRGRIVKHAPDGQRFEVRVAEDGSEVVLRKLSRA